MADTNALRAFSLIGVRVQVSLGALGVTAINQPGPQKVNVDITARR